MSVFDDVRGLEERALSQRADRAAMTVRSEHLEAKLVLMESVARFAQRVAANVYIRSDAGRRQIGRATADLHEDSSFVRAVVDDVDRGRERVHRGRDPH